MVILTYKVRHNADLAQEVAKAKRIAQIAIDADELLTTRAVKHIGLKSVIANQILRKYGRDQRAKTVKSVKLTLPSQGLRWADGVIKISALKMEIPFDKTVVKINSLELDNEFAFVACSVRESPEFETKTHLGVDRNTTGNIATIAIKETGKVWKFGKQALHARKKYKAMRARLQHKSLYREVKRIKNKEARIVRDINHKVSRAIVNIAVKNASEIRLEDLKGIRKAKTSKSFKGTLNSWSFYQLAQFIEYKAQLAGVRIFKINPAYTSKACSHCGLIGDRNGKLFKCSCGHADHADVNAAFNIALPSLAIGRLQIERDICKGHTGKPQEATL